MNRISVAIATPMSDTLCELRRIVADAAAAAHEQHRGRT